MDLHTLNAWHEWLAVDTEHLSIETVKNIFTAIRSRKPKGTDCKDDAFKVRAADVSDSLMLHLQCGLPTMEDQSICSLAYCSILNLISVEKLESTLRNVLISLSSYQEKQYSRDDDIKLADCDDSRKCNVMIIGLINGLFKADTVIRDESLQLQKICDSIILISFKIVTKSCLSYSNVTFHSFKSLHLMMEKILILGIADRIVTEEMAHVLAFVIFSNWENSISGVREINSKSLRTFRELMEATNRTELVDSIKEITTQFSWNRARYLILSEVLPDLTKDSVFEHHILCRDGLELSLKSSSLVSAGSSLYKTMMRGLTKKKWCERFLEIFNNNMLGKEKCIQASILNHWLTPTLKNFPEVFEILMDSFPETLNDSDYYPVLHCLKIGRKTGRIFKDWRNVTEKEQHFKNIVYSGLHHIDEDVRSQALQVVCSNHQFSVISEEECHITKDFLILNINYNSTSFCNNIINSFTLIFIRLIESFLHIIKNSKDSSNFEKYHFIEEYFVWIHEFVMQNLQQPGNYHRKIFSLHINEIVLRYLYSAESTKPPMENSTGHTKNGSYRKAPNLTQVSKVVKYLKSKNEWHFQEQDNIQALINCLHDPTDDVRELSANIIIRHYSDRLLHLNNITCELFTNGLVLCNSRMFYEVESGCLMFKIIASLTELPSLPLENCSDLFEYLIKNATHQFELQKNDLLLSIYNNKPLHGLISALKVTVQHLNSLYSMTDGTLETLLRLSGKITNHFLNILARKSEQGGDDYPPSFAEMSENIENIIVTSAYEYDPEDNENKLHISNAHHLVLNDIWLNLDASCGLSCMLLLKYVTRMDKKTIGDCLNIMVAVLTRCRHKGAIEHAGVTLGIAIQHLTSLKNPEINELISSMLRDFLKQATSEDKSHGGSITRKSAGFTILVHRIISNDSREGKPLFYLAMDILLKALKVSTKHSAPVINETLMAANSTLNTDDMSNERDVPLARALHLLCRTVANSVLASYVVQFASELTTVCFDHLTSEQWQIRNAALQLYGALVPKIIGQKTRQGEETCPVSPYELFVHVPTLWNQIRNSLKAAYEDKFSKNILVVHSNLVPILSLLSSMARRQHYHSFCPSACAELNIEPVQLEDIFEYLYELLGSPIYTVRNISAKIIQSYFPFPYFYEHRKNKSKLKYSENELHGHLTALKYYVSYYIIQKKYLFTDEKLDWCNSFVHIVRDINTATKKSSFPVKTLFFEVGCLLSLNSEDKDFHINIAKDSIQLYRESKKSEKIQIAACQWIFVNVTHAIAECEERHLVSIVETFLKDKNMTLIEDICMPALKRRLKTNTLVQKNNYESLFEIIITYSKNINISKNTFEILYMLALKTQSPKRFDSLGVFNMLISNLNLNNSYSQGYLLPLLCWIKCDGIFDCADVLLELSRICRTLSKPDTSDTEYRYIAATSIHHLVEALFIPEETNSDDYEMKVNIIISAIWLLQDENSDVRNQCSKMTLEKDERNQSIHANIHLKTIFSRDFLLKVFSQSEKSAVTFLETVLSEIPSNTTKKDEDLQNPFDHNTSNTYWEPELLREIVLNLIVTISDVSAD